MQIDKVILLFQGTFDYGKQLLSAALVLRRSSRFNTEANEAMTNDLEGIWEQFEVGLQQRAERLSLAGKFQRKFAKVNISLVL